MTGAAATCIGSIMLSIIISWRDRDELERALPSVIDTARRRSASVHIVNYGGDEAALRRQIGAFAGSVTVVDAPIAQHFNKSRSNNIGAAAAPGDLLFFCDCDIILNDSVDALFDAVEAGQDRFGTVAGVRESETNARAANNLTCFGYTLQLRIRNGRSLTIVDNEEDAEDGTRQAPGLLCVRRSDFERINGYNGGFEGWGWEDQDMIARLTLGAGLERVQFGQVIHLSHDDAARTRHHPQQLANRWESRDRMFRQALANYDADRFTGTYRADAGLA